MKLNQLSSPVLFSGIAGEMRQGNIARIMGSPNRQRDNVIKGCRIRRAMRCLSTLLSKPRGETPLFDRPYDETADAIPEAAE